MKSTLRTLCAILLLFNSIGAFYGGISLISDPTGAGLHLDFALLQHTPFKNYLIPGMVLLSVNGIFSVIVLIALLYRSRSTWLLLTLQGMLLLGWIGIQILLIRTYYIPMHTPFLLMGLIFLASGLHLKKTSKVSAEAE